MGNTPSKYYVYDFLGEFYFSGTIREIIKNLKLSCKESDIYTSIKRESLVNDKFYILKSNTFNIHKKGTNPFWQSNQMITRYYGSTPKIEGSESLTLQWLIDFIFYDIEVNLNKIIFHSLSDKIEFIYLLQKRHNEVVNALQKEMINLKQEVYRESMREWIDFEKSKVVLKNGIVLDKKYKIVKE